MSTGDSISSSGLAKSPLRIGKSTAICLAGTASWVGLAIAYGLGAPTIVVGVLWAASGVTCAASLSGTGMMSSARAASLFGRLYRNAPHPAYLVRPDGVILRSNGAAQRGDPAGNSIDALFGAALEAPDITVYKLGRSAEAEGHSSTMCRLDGVTWQVSVERFVEGFQLWRLQPPPVAETAPAFEPEQDDDREAAPDTDDLLEELPVALVRLDLQGRILFVNRAARSLLKHGADQGVALSSLLEGLGKPIDARVKETSAGRAQGRSEVARGKTEALDGFLQVTMTRMEDPDGPTILTVLSDATELKTLEAQFVQSQKMQAVGQLAGGIAHDFNNLLTAINGHCDLLLLRHLQGDSDHADLMQIRQNANRAAALVRQLLAFSRKQTLRPQVLHLFDTLAELANLLNRLLGERVELDITNSEDIWPVRVDERQLEQVIVNLVVNARDAMPDGGVVALRTRKVTLEAPMERDRAIVPPGRYSVIEVEDNGIGIPSDRLTTIFEPFYTTKKVGEGTGLGLSTAYGIIKQMDGYIFVNSTPGEGTTFQLYLPVHEHEDGVEDTPGRAPAEPPARHREAPGTGVVLLVEDEAPVRAFAARALQMRGYTVLEAESGEAALELLEDDDLKVDLFVSDVVMPGINGPTWVREAYEKRPQSSTVFVSGYSEDMFVDGQDPVPRSSFLPKPFTLSELIERVRDHMDRYVA